MLSFAGEFKTGAAGADGRLGVGVGVSAGLGAQAKPKTETTLKMTTRAVRNRGIVIMHLPLLASFHYSYNFLFALPIW
jgi:hypothetical protein